MASAPPLRIWLYSAALSASVLALLALLRWAPWREPDMAVALHTQQFLAAPAAAGNVRILALGSSLLWASTPPGQIPVVPGVNWMRMTKPATGIGYLRPSLEVIDHFPPDVLVIDENLLVLAQDSAAMEAMRMDFYLATKKLAYRLIGQQWLAPELQYPALLDQRASFQCEEIAPMLLSREVAQRNADIKRWFHLAPVDRELTQWLQRLSLHGVRIVLLEMRRSELVEQVIAPEKKDWQMRLRQALPAGPNIRYLASPAFTQANLHCDGRHMNIHGVRLFAPWWAAQLQQLRDGR
ncbi:hypothetical protein [Janthinobacterium violaceinigrum]|uniref:SGNH/GDSL hydrolase family protein n=1 Tax=Janthinobacterium violaceinigrum TaxID=2654252 RepID=A0A6I1I573_9BURK|nr:hypothetical protein [Janthinobacterium violaceinigrum]KAB8066082.1 hypothetical protein GCN75_05065 [Janthinobacterium violaceinigrum]